MALTYEQSNELMRDATFQGRVKVACLKFATYITNEATNTPAHSTRLRWANQCFTGPDGTAATVTPATVMDATIQEKGGSATDDEIQSSVETVINKML